MKSARRWAIGCTATVGALLVGGFALVGSFLADQGCPILRPGDLGAGAAAARLERAVAALPGVLEPDVRLSPDTCESQLHVRVAFDRAATADQIAAVVRHAIEGMQNPELAGYAATATFRVDDRGPDPVLEDGWFSLRWVEATRIPVQSLLDEGRAWADLSTRYPGSTVAVVNRWGPWEREVTVAVHGDDADAVPAAFGFLRGLPFPERDEMSWQVCPTDDTTHPRLGSCEQVEGALPPE